MVKESSSFCVFANFSFYRKIKVAGVFLNVKLASILTVESIPALDYLSSSPPVGVLVSSALSRTVVDDLIPLCPQLLA